MAQDYTPQEHSRVQYIHNIALGMRLVRTLIRTSATVMQYRQVFTQFPLGVITSAIQ